MRINIQARWVIAIAGLNIVTAVVLVGFLLYNFYQASNDWQNLNDSSISNTVIESITRQGTELSGRLAADLSSPIHDKNLSQIQQLLFTARGQPDIADVFLFGVPYDSRWNNLNTVEGKIEPELLQQVLTGKSVSRLEHDNKMLFLRPILYKEKIVGGLVLTISFTELQNSISRLKEYSRKHTYENVQQYVGSAVLITLFLCTLSGLMTVILVQWDSKSIKKLLRFAQDMGARKPYREIHLRRKDELGELGIALNQMSKDLKKRSSEIERLAFFDSLTDLPNRRLFFNILENALEFTTAQQKRLAVLFVDLDSFKRINDSLGHQFGDLLIKEVVSRLSVCIDEIKKSHSFVDALDADNTGRKSLLLSRLGGDEFVVLYQGLTNNGEVDHIAERILAALEPAFFISNHELIVSASIGIALFPQNGTNALSLLRNADRAMYQVKEQGKRGYGFYQYQLDKKPVDRLSLEAELRNALAGDEFELWYQPWINHCTDEITGAEALIRWNSPNYGIVSPDIFIPVAEECGLIHEIGEWVISTALDQLVKWNRNLSPNFHISVNVSAAQLQKRNIGSVFEQAVRASGALAKNLHVEVTESSLIFDKAISHQVLTYLQKLGIRVWLDDFGTGYSSLSHLKYFNVDGVKIDKSFVSGANQNPADHTLALAIVAIAKTLKLEVVAEGVETVQNRAIFPYQSALYLQGNYFSMPVPADQLEAWYFSYYRSRKLEKQI